LLKTAACFQNEFQVFPETQIKHFVGFIQHDSFKIGDIEYATFEVITQTTGRSDNNMRSVAQPATFALGVHATDTRQNTRACLEVKPFKFTFHLHGQFTGGSHDQSQRTGIHVKTLCIAKQCLCNGQTIGHGFA
jgi:hypothetical protein